MATDNPSMWPRQDAFLKSARQERLGGSTACAPGQNNPSFHRARRPLLSSGWDLCEAHMCTNRQLHGAGPPHRPVAPAQRGHRDTECVFMLWTSFKMKTPFSPLQGLSTLR